MKITQRIIELKINFPIIKFKAQSMLMTKRPVKCKKK